MHLNWQLHPKQINVQVATSAAFQYHVQTWNDGQAALTVQHRGDRPSAKPIKYFVYKGRTPAFNGAQRFEDKHGYRDPAYHVPAAVVPFLMPFSKASRDFIQAAQYRAQGKMPLPSGEHDAATATEMATEDYDALCDELLCCRVYDCYNRVEPVTQQCDTHRTDNETTED